ncbi:MAG: outer membrane protein assembly factor BamD [Gemmatimonadetes bacterium]|nr:outer membrane protein assembly factor BamD [Gemmatimonadota bacterium]
MFRKRWMVQTLITAWLAAMPQLAAAQSVSPGETWQGQRAAVERAAVAGHDAAYPQDPADSLYRAARERLNRNAYRDAARLFAQLNDRYPRSSYAPQAMYYRAFALYRLGQTAELRAARDVLRRLTREHAEAAIAQAEAEQLMARIEGELASRGDEQAARDLARRARELERREEALARSHRVRERHGAYEACSPEDEVRMAALNGLLQMNPDQAKPILRRVLEREDDCPQIRVHALMVLGQHATEEDLDVMLGVAQNDPVREVRAQAVFWLSQVPGERTLDVLEEILVTSEDDEMRHNALFALSQHDSQRAEQTLRDFALQEDAPASLRAQAIMWIGQKDTPEANRFLRRIYETTDAREIKESVFLTLAQRGGEENRQFLMDIAMDETEERGIRHQAMYWAARTGMPLSDLRQLYESVDDRELKEAIIFSLVQRDDEETIPFLLEIAREETNTELRARLVFWLSQKDDPRVEEFLMEIIEGGGS